jgi:hypothetical protein
MIQPKWSLRFEKKKFVMGFEKKIYSKAIWVRRLSMDDVSKENLKLVEIQFYFLWG